MRLRVVSWNLDSGPTGLLDAKVALLRRLRPDLALLQELSRPVYRTLLPHRLVHERIHAQPRIFAWGVLSTDICRPRGSDYRLGCAVLGSSATVLLDAGLLDSAPFGVGDPQRVGLLQRTVAARVAISGDRTLTACSFHARPAPQNPATPVPPAFATGIAGWLAEQPGSVVFGMDSDAAVVDHGECRCLAPPHGDHIWATPDLTPAAVGYLYDEALASGSDHAVVLADFEV